LNQTPSKNLQLIKRPRIGVTIGDAAGIGTEVVLKSIAELSVQNCCLPVIIGDAAFLRSAAAKLALKSDYRVVRKAREIVGTETLIFDCANINAAVEFGVESALTGQTSAEFIETGVKLCLEKRLDAIATAPISKNALALAGIKFPGHTEMLAALTRTREFAMSFFAGSLRVVLLSTHVSLKNALNLIKKDALVNLIRLTNRELQKLGIRQPRIAVAALNPHAGENQMFGDEEVLEINPAVDECRREQISVSGAFSADTIFLRNARGEFDATIALYHDQATIAVKSIAFGEAVNVTLGLPIIRTSVDHGTAFDIAGKNMAEHSSMTAAICLAADLARKKDELKSKVVA
jgi:4-hydroxythreonine-4-phosphate dehydrogenase